MDEIDAGKTNSKKKKEKPEYNTLQDFLKTRLSTKFPGKKITHTRIGNQSLGVWGGAYVINKKEDINTFQKLYYDKVLTKDMSEYLTEIQDRENGGPILVDLDFRYKGISEREHKEAHIDDIIEIYIEKIGKLIEIKEEVKNFQIYVFEKDEMNVLTSSQVSMNNNEYTAKDGIHMYIGLTMKHEMQRLLRTMVVERLNDCLDDLRPEPEKGIVGGLVNDVEDIVDKGVASGEVGWQVYGSKKPGGKPYKLTGIFKIKYNDETYGYDIESSATKDQVINFKEKSNILKIFAVRNNTIWKQVEISETMKEKWILIKKEEEKKKTQVIKYVSLEDQDSKFELYIENNGLEMIKSEEDLQKAIKAFIFESGDQNLINAHAYTMLLGANYYEPYDKWLKVGMALQHTNQKLILSWLKFSSKSDKFDWDDDVRDIPNRWDHFKKNKSKTLTIGSIKYWAKEEDPQAFNLIRKETIDNYVRETLFGKGTEYDLARLAHLMYKDRFACVSCKKAGEWWEFGKSSHYNRHTWCENDSGTSLRREISKTMSSLYIDKESETIELMRQTMNNVNGNGTLEKVLERLTNESAIFNQIAIQLRRTTHKQNIMKECKDEFRDEYLLEKLDSDPYKIACNNGIYDFKGNPHDVKELHNNSYKTVTKYKGIFRPGCPEDYMSMSTRRDYIKIDYDNEEHAKIVNSINIFMEQLFVDENLRRYMWEHLATSVIGTNSNQTFNIYNGNGSNGKSVLITFMKKVLGDYADIAVPITLVMGNRTAIGIASPEIANLKGVRFACMQESTKGDKLNDGVMKQLTGKDPLTGRKLFHDPITFYPQFTLVCCLNTMPTISSNDGGTWRRIRKVDFESKFIDIGAGQQISDVIADKQFPMDKYLEEIFDEWAPFMLAMLIDKAQERMGLVDDCEKVKEASNAYRNNEDYLTRFYSEKLVDTGNAVDRVTKTSVKTEFQNWFRASEGQQSRMPPMTELIAFLDLKYEQTNNQVSNLRHYKSWKIIYDTYDDEVEYENEA
ncbi:MAG: hypothetical protein CXT73_06495 [Methanobacteriota archaeon]|nr:MAG: hypothetical protein CXT73_06495 [Euryarchaeota archaeon]